MSRFQEQRTPAYRAGVRCLSFQRSHTRYFFVILWTAAISSGVSRQLIAFAFSVTCSAVVAPLITLEISGCVASQPTASSIS